MSKGGEVSERLDDRLIVALDAGSEHIREIVRALPGVATFKIGMEAFYREGAPLVEWVRAKGHEVFLDLKLHDIPNTVQRAARVVASLGVRFVTVHASGGREMLSAALEGVSDRPGTRVLGVTLLTSLTEATLPAAFDPATTVGEKVESLAALACEGGCHGVVASAGEASRLRRALGPEVAIVCPGIRPGGTPRGDHGRSATPTEAVAWGADYVVVGRPITSSTDPAAAALAISDELRAHGTVRNA